MILEEKMEKDYVCYLMNNLIDDVNDTMLDMNLVISEKRIKTRS
jgi:hypothetical protein